MGANKAADRIGISKRHGVDSEAAAWVTKLDIGRTPSVVLELHVINLRPRKEPTTSPGRYPNPLCREYQPHRSLIATDDHENHRKRTHRNQEQENPSVLEKGRPFPNPTCDARLQHHGRENKPQSCAKNHSEPQLAPIDRELFADSRRLLGCWSGSEDERPQRHRILRPNGWRVSGAR